MPDHRLFLLSAIVACACAPLAAADPSVPVAAAAVPTEVIARAAVAPVIDGRLDDDCWKAVAPIPVDQPNNPDQPRIASPAAIVRYAWDEHYLYIAYETFDRNLVAVGSGQRQGPPGNQRDGCSIWLPDQKVDVVEFFVTAADPRFFWELHHNALNQFNDVWCVATDPSWPIHHAAYNRFGILFNDQEWIQDDGGCTLATAVTLKPKADGTPSTIGGTDVDTGYCAELRIPWLSLGLPPERMAKDKPGSWQLDGAVISLLAVVQDGDREQRYYRSGPFGTSNWFHLDEAVWPKYRLRDLQPAAAGK